LKNVLAIYYKILWGGDIIKVSKSLSNGGYHITVEIGGREWSSYWSAPGDSIDHAGLRYITDRYPIIRTEKRASEFKRQYKNLWIEVTPYQLELMQHSIGLGRAKKPYRNYFFTQADDKNWNELVIKELVIKGTNHPNNDEYIYFYLTKLGVEFSIGKKVTDNEYKEL
jgi:hypothetical protein